MVGGCQHEWRWLPRPHITIGVIGRPNEAVNVECVRCGARDWKHGTMPRPRAAIGQVTPTTERS